ncbi:hypothetical protein HanPI659440_Chr04g0148461 [Helianthus annuus]|nr:hypothetical protein HanPI659440_Chr04g0148461 [Helianthus annuus]
MSPSPPPHARLNPHGIGVMSCPTLARGGAAGVEPKPPPHTPQSNIGTGYREIKRVR